MYISAFNSGKSRETFTKLVFVFTKLVFVLLLQNWRMETEFLDNVERQKCCYRTRTVYGIKKKTYN